MTSLTLSISRRGTRWRDAAGFFLVARRLHLVPRVAGDSQQGRIVLDWDNTPHERKELDRLAADLRLQLQPQGD